MTDKENQPTGLHRDLFLAISKDISLAIELDLGNKYKKTTNCDSIEHKLPIPGKAQAKAMPGWLYPYTK